MEESKTLKQELLDRDNRIESLNQKNRQLLESNQRYVEQSQHMMEKRSDSLHSISSANSSHIIKFVYLFLFVFEVSLKYCCCC